MKEVEKEVREKVRCKVERLGFGEEEEEVRRRGKGERRT